MHMLAVMFVFPAPSTRTDDELLRIDELFLLLFLLMAVFVDDFFLDFFLLFAVVGVTDDVDFFFKVDLLLLLMEEGNDPGTFEFLVF